MHMHSHMALWPARLQTMKWNMVRTSLCLVRIQLSSPLEYVLQLGTSRYAVRVQASTHARITHTHAYLASTTFWLAKKVGEQAPSCPESKSHNGSHQRSDNFVFFTADRVQKSHYTSSCD